ncbi:amino acid ABC transporter permease [Bifidobacterium sp.]|uniref:amino acid ABC transporter permease n=1 Tax=Bifidobacterium sp. TaxID=41200 RepID=UPI0025BA0A5C|nr:amino acid ABC transporter permease [Bifidobacterium sp.]MCH4208648.1 amino acid ABC transporter permease [Bifidobacterium sp.]MCI1224380.1 amino acid ABC transporter permease [Bifidobacterium sp.]
MSGNSALAMSPAGSAAPSANPVSPKPTPVKVQRRRSNRASSSLLFDEPGPRTRRKIAVANVIGVLVLLGLLALVLLRLSAPPHGQNQLSGALWKPALSLEAWTDFYLPGIIGTIEAAVVAVIGAVVFGIVFGIGRLVPLWPVRAVCSVIVEFCRAVPVLLFMIFFWRLFSAIGISDAASFYAVVLGLILYNGSVIAELVRSGVGNLPRGQREAAIALGMSPLRSLLSIEVPQAVIAMLPAAVTQLVVVLKDTALGSIIVYTDLLQESRRLGSAYFNILQTLLVAAVIYFIVCWLLSRLAEWLPARMQRRTTGASELEPVAPIAILDASNLSQIAVAKESQELPYGGAPLQHHVRYRGSNAAIQDWQRISYIQGYDFTHPETQIDPRALQILDFLKPRLAGRPEDRRKRGGRPRGEA